MAFLYREGQTKMFVELSKESCKAIHAEMEAEWVATQEEKIPGSTRIKYGEYACKAWQAAEKADEDMHRRRALGEKVTWKAKHTRYRSNLSGYFSKRISTIYLVQISARVIPLEEIVYT